MLSKKRWTDLDNRLRDLIGNSQEYDKKILSYSIENQLRYRGNLVRFVIDDEHEYYQRVLKYSRDHLMLFPHHLSDFIITGMQITPFQFYLSTMAQVIEQEKGHAPLSDLNVDFVDKFYSHFTKEFDKYGPNSHKPLIKGVCFLRDCHNLIGKVPHDTLKERILFELKTQLLASKPYYMEEYFEATYFRAFRVFLEKSKNDDYDIDCDDYAEFDEYAGMADIKGREDACPGCSIGKNYCECSEIYKQFIELNDTLNNLELLEILADDTIKTVARAFIERKVAARGKSNYSSSYLSELADWVHDVVKRWITDIYKNATNPSKIDEVSQMLDQHLRDAYAEVRVSHMFEIIIEYPNSEAAIQDLKLCLEQSTSSIFRLNLIESVKQSLVESLLHPGVNTYDILTAYISAIKALRALDPSGLILQLVTEPVRRYLKSRNDTVRCIVTALTDEDHNSELNREMIRSGTQTNENGLDGKGVSIEMNLPCEGERCTAANFEKWKPDPIKLTSSDDVMKTSRFSDIVSILVNIYETKDLFVEEYQKLLSQRLLNKYDECNLDTELRNLELLTLRFSDCELHRCEVMLKDVQTSKRVNKRILSGDIREHKLENFKNLNVLIVSSPFWPEKFSPIATLYDEPTKIKFPEEIQSAIDTYTEAFEAIQASRTLHWRHHLGSVNLDVTINGKIQNFTVSPLHVAILYLFQNKKIWRLHEIIQETSMTAATIRSRLALWQRNGLIRDCGEDKFELITE